MKFNPKAFLVFLGFAGLIAAASSGDGGGWSHVAEAAATIVILLAVAGFLRDTGTATRRRSN